MTRSHAAAVLLPVVCAAFALSARAADGGRRTYLHRSRGADLRAVELIVSRTPDGNVQYMIGDFPSGGESKITLLTDAGGKPVEYSSEPNQAGGYECKFSFGATNVVYSRKLPGKPNEEYTCSVRSGSLPDFNSRPDPYLTEHVLIRAYDFAKGGKQTLDVYDTDSTGKGVAEYQVSLELADEDGVRLPNGKFKARHLVQLQQSSAPTWYKKRRGSQTDIWVNGDGTILRIFRHREPYEVILQNYDNERDLIAKSETAQAYAQPPVKAP